MAVLPGRSFLHAMVLSQASTAASSVLPGGDAVGMAHVPPIAVGGVCLPVCRLGGALEVRGAGSG